MLLRFWRYAFKKKEHSGGILKPYFSPFCFYLLCSQSSVFRLVFFTFAAVAPPFQARATAAFPASVVPPWAPVAALLRNSISLLVTFTALTPESKSSESKNEILGGNWSWKNKAKSCHWTSGLRWPWKKPASISILGKRNFGEWLPKTLVPGFCFIMDGKCSSSGKNLNNSFAKLRVFDRSWLILSSEWCIGCQKKWKGKSNEKTYDRPDPKR